MKKRIALFFLTLFTFCNLAKANTITVNSVNDVISNDGACTLREAVIAANTDAASGGASGECTAGSGTDTIQFDASTNGTPICLSITGSGENASATGDLDVTRNLSIEGNGADVTIIDGGNRTAGGTSSCGSELGDSIFNIISLANTVSINNITIEGGASGIRAISSSTLYITNSIIQYNSLVGTNHGGGIYSNGSVNLTNTRVIHNLVQGNGTNTLTGGGISISGNSNSLNMTNSEVSSNTLDSAGSSSGAGITFQGSSMNITNSTVANNNISNSTAGYGAGIYCINTSGVINIISSTIAENSGSTAGAFYAQGATINLLNTLIADNNTATTNNDCHKDSSTTITSYGYNLIENNCGITLVTGTGADLTGDPSLGSLADNGGDTYTKSLSAGSIALNAGTCTNTINSDDISADQRGESRGGTCDIGAFEAVCGDGVQTGDETCDDGNGSDDDECNNSCRIQTLYYYDSDGDHYGDDSGSIYTTADDPQVVSGTLVAVGGDCDDADVNINTSASEVCDDSVDNNCDGVVDEECDTSTTSDTTSGGTTGDGSTTGGSTTGDSDTTGTTGDTETTGSKNESSSGSGSSSGCQLVKTSSANTQTNLLIFALMALLPMARLRRFSNFRPEGS